MMKSEEKLMKLPYRIEIDGLRAVAIISVILYHAQMVFFGKTWFEGGYVGVDIFFVISGYLITRIILIELYQKGSFSFISFYERRARRILCNCSYFAGKIAISGIFSTALLGCRGV